MYKSAYWQTDALFWSTQFAGYRFAAVRADQNVRAWRLIFRPTVASVFKNGTPPKPLLPETEVDLILNDIKNLSSGACLVKYHQYKVYMARHEEMPHVMREIGRLGELTFRVGKDTNHETDLDYYDAHYHQIITSFFCLMSRPGKLWARTGWEKAKKFTENIAKKAFTCIRCLKYKLASYPW